MNREEFKEYLEKLEEIHKKYIEELDEKTREIQSLDTYYVCYLIKNINKDNRRIYKLQNALDEIEKWLKEKADRSNLNDLLEIIKKAKGE